MTNEEALKSFDGFIKGIQGTERDNTMVLLLWKIRVALERQTPQKPKHLCCPNCMASVHVFTEEKKGFGLRHCVMCGQAIDWSGKHDK